MTAEITEVSYALGYEIGRVDGYARGYREGKELRSAVVALADAAELLHKQHAIMQPFLAICKEHGETIQQARESIGDQDRQADQGSRGEV